MLSATKIPKKEIERGTRHEYEHRSTIGKIRTGKLTTRESAKMIALDHLREDPMYYSKLDSIESGKKMAKGGIIEGKLHSECDNRSGCGENFSTIDGSKIEAENGEAIITGDVVKRYPVQIWEIEGTPAQISSALNFLGGGIVFMPGAKIYDKHGSRINMPDTAALDTTPARKLQSYNIFINRTSMAQSDVFRVRGTARQIASAINKIGGGLDFAPGAYVNKVMAEKPKDDTYGPVIGTAGYGYMINKDGTKRLMRISWDFNGYVLTSIGRKSENFRYTTNEIKELISNQQFVVIMAKKRGKITG